MSKVLIIGAGGVGGVVAHKAAMEKQVFSDVLLASRTKSKCDAIAAQIEQMHGRKIRTAQVDADDVPQLVRLLKDYKPQVVIYVALPYQDLHIMDACLEAGVDYLDTANYEPLDVAKFEYKWQWAYQDRFAKAGRMALLGSGFAPGMTNVFCAYVQKHLLDEIHYVDILVGNVGMTRIDEVEFNGMKIVPIQFLRALLPDPASLAQNYSGKTSIGCLCEGINDGKPKRYFIYNICDHAETYKEVRAQAISYTTGVPAVTGAVMMVTKKWKGNGVFNMEQLDPDPFLEDVGKRGLPWHVEER